ncbi:MAG TPA: Ig-like domain-containing protein [Longimicrobium sp.]
MANRTLLARSGVLLCLLAAACDRAPTDAGPPLVDPEPSVPGRMDCSVAVATGALTCATPDPSTGAASGLVVGGPNGTYVLLTASGHTYTPADSVFSIDVTVQNQLFQPLGTTDGTAAHADSVRVYFVQEPHASVMNPPALPTVPVDLVNERRGFLTQASQAYFQYGAPLQPNATSAPVEWQFRMPPEVERFTFSVVVFGAVQHPDGVVQVTPAADTVLAGQTVSLSHAVVNAYGDNVADQTVTWGTSAPSVATVSAAGLVTAVAPGTAVVTATQGTRTGSATIAVCPDLALGGVYAADMPTGAGFCLGAGEYVVMPVNTDETASVSLGVTGAGIVPVSGAPTPALLPGGPAGLRVAPRPRRDGAWESRLRRMERTTLPRGTGPMTRAGGARMAITPGVPAVGALMNLNVETGNACSTFDTRTGRVVAVGTRVIVLADTLNPSGGLSAADYQAVADSFDTVIWPAITGVYGAPGDIDGNGGRVIAFYTRAVNELTPPASSSFVGGFFFSRDLFPAASCPTSNVGEMFYMLAADPSGTVNGNVRSVSFILDSTLGTLAHEFEHLVNASRRMHVNTPWNGNFEDTWLDEGLAHISEELVFHARAGTSPGANLGLAQIADGGNVEASFFRYAESNFGRLRQWLLSPATSGGFQGDDDLSTRGAAWAFLRYASDRSPSTDAAFFNALLNTGNTGLTNLQAVLGTDPLPWYRDFVAAMYGDDAGIGAAATYTQPSWDFRNLYANLDYNPGPTCSCAYELAVRDPGNGVTDSFTLASGGAAAYARMGVPAGGFASVTVLSGGVAPASTVRVIVIRRE